MILALAIVATIAQSVELSIVGHVLGHGIQALNYSGSNLNVSILENGTFFMIRATGGSQ
jgi:hypothetical protein